MRNGSRETGKTHWFKLDLMPVLCATEASDKRASFIESVRWLGDRVLKKWMGVRASRVACIPSGVNVS